MACALALSSVDSRLAAQQPPTALPPVFSLLEGSWEGSGVLLGRQAAFEMRWEAGTAGFVMLSFSNAWLEDGGATTPVLSARATYLVDGVSASGVWIDDRPQRLRLEAVVTDSSVVTNWVADTERGRTEYIVRGRESVVVRDVVIVEGADRLFAEATYRRASIPAGDATAARSPVPGLARIGSSGRF